VKRQNASTDGISSAMSMPFLLLYIYTVLHNLYSLSRFEAIPDKLAPDEVLQQAQSAAKAAADKLALQAPNSKVCAIYSYLVDSADSYSNW